MDDIHALGSQKTRLIMQPNLKKQLAARFQHHKKKQGKLVEREREREKDGVSGETDSLRSERIAAAAKPGGFISSTKVWDFLSQIGVTHGNAEEVIQHLEDLDRRDES
ncbi:hypothetical protein Ancab_025009, partial [Ancistrocladus abbreviatus]